MNPRTRCLLSPASLLLATSLFGCAADDGLVKGDDLAAADEVQGVTVLGDIAYGASRTAVYAPPARQAYRFRGAVGDQVDVRVRSTRGDAMVWLFDPTGRVAATNDDADGTLDARVAHTLTRAGTWLIAFRDYNRQRQTFTVSLANVTPAADHTSCARDSEYVVVSAGGCCGRWQRTAVNAASVEAHAAANVCRPPFPPCAQPNEEITARELTKVAICGAERRCVAVQPEEIRCGGRTTNPHTCPSGFACYGPDLARDIPGSCVRGCTAADGSTVAPEQGYRRRLQRVHLPRGRPLGLHPPRVRPVHRGRPHLPARRDLPRGLQHLHMQPQRRGDLHRQRVHIRPRARAAARRYVAHSPEPCRLVHFACAAGQQMFSNDCGCGCEPTP